LIATTAIQLEDDSAELENQIDCSLSKYECCPDGVTGAKVLEQAKYYFKI
jgi:hypothetical protein